MSESVAKVVFIRHGESQGNAKNVYTGWDDTPLSIKGEQEAEEAGLCLKAKGVKFDIVFTSALQLLGQQNHKLRSFCSWWVIQYCWKLQFLSFPSSFLLRFCFTSHQSYPIIPPHPAALWQAVCCSRRATKTAELVLKVSRNSSVEIDQSWKLNARHSGGLQGLTQAEAVERYGESKVTLWRSTLG